MRIVHLSDIHLSYTNYQYFKTVFLKALINDLKAQSKTNSFDLIIISGDLVDKGGDSLYGIKEYIGRESEICPFEIFKELFLDKITLELQISQNKILFVPGNHDIDESGILLREESDLIENIIKKKHDVTEILELNEENFKHSLRVKGFKEFEKKFHSTQVEDYIFTNNQSVYIYEDSQKVTFGFILLNDAWRCKSIQLAKEQDHSFKLNLGSKQIYDGLDELKNKNTDVIICIMHHPIDKFNDKEEIEGIFLTEKIDIVLFGDLHQTDFKQPTTVNGKYISSQCKASFSNHNQFDINYLCGYQILEINKTALASISYRVFDGRPHKKKFLPDVSMGTDGIYNDQGLGIPFRREITIDANNKNNFRN